jgi:hypothetical protein
MDKFKLRKKYETETKKDRWAPERFYGDEWVSIGSYSNDYVKWLEEQLTSK